MPQRNVNLTEHFDEFIDRSLASGRFSNASEIVREGLRLLELQEREAEARIAWLRSAATTSFGAIDRGEGLTFASADELDGYLAGLDEEPHGSATARS